jgi:uncharacterized protein YcfL
MKPEKISLQEAIAIHQLHARKSPQRVTICYAGQWYDIRGMSTQEVELFIQSIINPDTKIIETNI